MAKRATYCSICKKAGAEVIFCGYCKARTGRREEHILCNECFLKGCPKVPEEEKTPSYPYRKESESDGPLLIEMMDGGFWDPENGVMIPPREYISEVEDEDC